MKMMKTPKFKMAKINVKAVAGSPTSAKADAYGKEAKKRIMAFGKKASKR